MNRQWKDYHHWSRAHRPFRVPRWGCCYNPPQRSPTTNSCSSLPPSICSGAPLHACTSWKCLLLSVTRISQLDLRSTHLRANQQCRSGRRVPRTAPRLGSQEPLWSRRTPLLGTGGRSAPWSPLSSWTAFGSKWKRDCIRTFCSSGCWSNNNSEGIPLLRWYCTVFMACRTSGSLQNASRMPVALISLKRLFTFTRLCNSYVKRRVYGEEVLSEPFLFWTHCWNGTGSLDRWRLPGRTSRLRIHGNRNESLSVDS